MIQKLMKVGSSAAVTIPKKSLETLGLKVGDSVQLSFEGKRVVIERADDAVDTSSIDWARSFIDRYRPALEELKDK